MRHRTYFDVRLLPTAREGSANTKQPRLQKMWKRRPVMPEPHLFAGLIKRTSFTFDEYFRFRSAFVSLFLSLSLGFRCLVILPTLFHFFAFLPVRPSQIPRPYWIYIRPSLHLALLPSLPPAVSRGIR